MRIRKVYKSSVPEGKIMNSNSDSLNDTYSCNYINSINNYSTEEQVIGKWIDGKPVYRKIIDTNDNSSNILHGISNLKNVITCKGNIKRTSSAVVSQLFPHIDTNSNYNVDVNYFSSTTIYLLIGTSILSSITGFRLILEYTKTTD